MNNTLSEYGCCIYYFGCFWIFHLFNKDEAYESYEEEITFNQIYKEKNVVS
jgi:hypothetical protein